MSNEDKNLDKKIGKNIKRIRNDRKITQKELAEALGIIEQTVSKIERGIFSPSFSTLLKICEILDTTPNELLLEDSEWKDWKTEQLEQLDYSITGLSDKISLVEDQWARADMEKEKGNQKAERFHIDMIIGMYAWTNDHYREIADYLYQKDLKNYLSKMTSEVRKNKLSNLNLFD